MNSIVIVTRHEAAIQWLEKQGIVGNIISHVNEPAEIAGTHVIGNVPLYLASYAEKISQIMIPNRPEETRGRDLTLEEMEQFGAYLQTFVVTEIPFDAEVFAGAVSSGL